MSDEDPEIVADRKLRAYSERDPSRSRGDGVYDWKPPASVTQWKCRTPPCKVFVGIDADTVEQWEMFNRELKKRGEKPIASHEVVRCPSCEAEMVKIQPLRLRKRADRMADVIRQLKDGATSIRWKSNDGEHVGGRREALDQLKTWGHPDVIGLEQALTEKSAPNKKPGRGYV